MLRSLKETLTFTAIFTCLALRIFCTPTPAQAQSVAPGTDGQTLEEADTDLVGAAAIVARAAPLLSEVWPGFWSADKAYAFTNRDPETILLVTATEPPEDYILVSDPTIPEILVGRAYLRRGFPRGFGGFHQFYEIGELVVPAMWLEHAELQRSLAHFYHEAFHGFQREAFVANPAHRSAFAPGGSRLAIDSVRLPQLEFMAAEERRMLIRALNVKTRDALVGLLQEYLALRAERTEMLPSIQAFERWEERYEGTATLVGYQSAVLATGAGTERVRELLVERLSSSEPALRNGEANKWRGYSVGAALGFLLDQLGYDWRAAVEQGSALDALLSQALSPGSARAD